MVSSNRTLTSIVLVIFFFGRTLVNGGVFDTVQDKSHFIRGKDLAVITDRSDIVINADISPFPDNIKRYCKFASLLDKSDLLSHIKRRFDDLCTEAWNDWYILRDLVGLGANIVHARLPRGLLSMATSFLVGGVSEAIFGTEYNSHELKDLEEDSQTLATAIHDEDIRIGLTEKHMAELATVLASQEKRVEFTQTELEAAIAVLASFQELAWVLGRTIRGLTLLFTSSTLAQELLKPGAIDNELNHISKLAASRNLEPLITSELDLLRTPVSYMVTKAGTIRIVAHVPMTPAAETF